MYNRLNVIEHKRNLIIKKLEIQITLSCIMIIYEKLLKCTLLQFLLFSRTNKCLTDPTSIYARNE